MRKGKKLSGKGWRRLVRVLSCIVVFCTTYALILPAITQEAQAYCGDEEHTHTADCYEKILTCAREEHTHSKDCQDEDGTLICGQEEHEHGDDCYRELLKCSKTEHEHSLECFSDPEADVETAADWEKTLPEEKDLKDKSQREQIVMIASSQNGYKESEKNYLVENETEIKGYSRYGAWDEDPYEDWSGAYSRFVLDYSGIDTEDAEKKTSEWLDQLHEKEELEPVTEAEAGDVLFTYNDKDQLKAGIVKEADEKTVTAYMGDWKNRVSEEVLNLDSEDLHSIWKPAASEKTTETDEPETPIQEEPVKEEPKEETTAEPEKEQTEPESAETEEVKYDYTQEVEAEDGTIIRASWNRGTFADYVEEDLTEEEETTEPGPQEGIVFQAKTVELSEEEQKKVQEQLDQDKEYSFRNYDLTFYVRGADTELVEIEPSLPVKVEMVTPNELPVNDSELPVFHFYHNGEIELLERRKEKPYTEKIVFDSDSFTVYSIPSTETDTPAENARSVVTVNSADALQKAISNGNTIQLANDIKDRYGFKIDNVQDLTIDLNGHSLDSGYIQINITNNSRIRIINSGSTGGIIGMNDQGGRIISVYNSELDLDNVTIRNNQKTIRCGGILAVSSKITIDGGGIENCDSRKDTYQIDHYYGGGLYARDGSSIVLGPNNPPLIKNNIANEGGGIAIGNPDSKENDRSTLVINNARIEENSTYDFGETKCYEGGGIALVADTRSSAIIYQAEILNNHANGKSTWGGGGIFAAQGTYLWLPNGASVYDNTSNSLGGGLTACSTGVMYIDGKMHIYNNHANADGSYSSGDKQNDGKYEDYNGNLGHRGQEGYRGEDIFSNMEAEVTGAYSNGTSANWTGIVDNNTFENSKDGFLVTKNKWMLLKASPNSTTGLDTQPVKIFRNTSVTHGAGILINGFLVTGDYSEDFIGDYLNLKGKKAYLDEDGKTRKQFDDQFKFGIYDSSGTLQAVGSSNSNGDISFPKSLYLKSSNKAGTETFNYTLREITDDLPGYISSDQKVYDLMIELTTQKALTYFKPVWDAQKQAYISKQVTIYRQYITKVWYKESSQNDWSEKIFNPESSTKTVSVPETGNSFVNTEVPVQDIVVKKVWNGDEAPVISLQVQLQNRVQGSSEFRNYGEPKTLSADSDWTFRWKNVPSKNSGGKALEYQVIELNCPDGWESSLSTPITTEETVTDPNATITKEVWVKADSIQTDKIYKMISIEAKCAFTASGDQSLPTVTGSAVIPDNQILKDVDNNTVVDGDFNSGTDISASTDGANSDKIQGLKSKTGNVLRTTITPHAWLRTETANSINGLSFQWTNEYVGSDYQGFIINSQGNLTGGINQNYFVNITCSDSKFGTESSGQPVQLYYKDIRSIPASTSRTTTVQTFTLTNSKPKYDLKIIKSDEDDSSKYLEGAEFALYNGQNEQSLTQIGEIQVTNDSGIAVFEGLEKGTYWLKEVKQPDGYDKPEDKYLKIEISGKNQETTIEVAITNKMTVYELPETGSIGTRFITATGSVFLLTATGLYGYNRKRKRKGGDLS